MSILIQPGALTPTDKEAKSRTLTDAEFIGPVQTEEQRGQIENINPNNEEASLNGGTMD